MADKHYGFVASRSFYSGQDVFDAGRSVRRALIFFHNGGFLRFGGGSHCRKLLKEIITDFSIFGRANRMRLKGNCMKVGHGSTGREVRLRRSGWDRARTIQLRDRQKAKEHYCEKSEKRARGDGS